MLILMAYNMYLKKTVVFVCFCIKFCCSNSSAVFGSKIASVSFFTNAPRRPLSVNKDCGDFSL